MLEFITPAGFLWILSCSCLEAVDSDSLQNLQRANQQENIIQSLYKFMLEIGSVYFEEIELLHIVLPVQSDNYTFYNSDLNDINTFVGKIHTKWPVLISKVGENVTNSSTIYIKVSHYIVFMTSNTIIDETDSFLKVLQFYKESWNPRGSFVFVFLHSGKNNIMEHSKVVITFFNHLWSKNIYKTVLFHANFNLINETKIITALPYTSNNLCRRLHNSSELMYWDLNSSLDSNIELFTFDVPKDFHGCSMNVMTYPFPPYSVAEEFEDNNVTKYEYTSGIEVNLVKLVAERFNIKITFSTPDLNLNPWFHFFPDGRTVGIIPDLIKFKTDIAFGGVIPISESYFIVDFTKCHSFGSISWFVADPSKLPQWTVLIRVFKTRAWIILLFVFVFFSLIFHLISKYSSSRVSEYNIYKRYATSIMILFIVGLNTPTQKPPKSNYLRLLFLTWSIYSLHIVITYQQHLFSLMVNPTLEKSINTLEELKESGLTTCLSGLFHALFSKKFNDKTLQYIFDNHIICNDIEESVELLMKYKNFSILDKSENIEFIDKNMEGNFHKVSDVLMIYNVGMLTSKGNIILDRLNTVIQKSQEAGLIAKWKNEFKLKSDTTFKIDSRLKSLTIDDLQGAFLILFLGFAFSLISFLKEKNWFSSFTVYQFTSILLIFGRMCILNFIT